MAQSYGGSGRAAAATAARWSLLTAAGLAVAQAGPGLTALGPVRRALFPRLCGRGPADHVALTFDDGPDPESTPRFLELLAERRVRATFFLLGSMTARAPGLAREISAAGHEIGVHGWQHRYLTLRGPRATYDDLRQARDVIATATGTTPLLFRPPYGVLSAGALAAAARIGLTPVLWDSWGKEWAPGATAGSVYAHLTGGLAGGATVLLHDSGCTSPPGSWQAALGALPMLLDECGRRGLRVGSLADHGLRGRRRDLAGGAVLAPVAAGDSGSARPPGHVPAGGNRPAGQARRRLLVAEPARPVSP